MSADSALRLILRAYTTPAKTAEGRLMVSRERADFCRDYLTSRYNIAANRITSFYYGSESMPVRATEDDWESQRCVELVIIEYTWLLTGGQLSMPTGKHIGQVW
jgi:outer membrane protein OmpA-like peptidoglycan-associated protein